MVLNTSQISFLDEKTSVELLFFTLNDSKSTLWWSECHNHCSFALWKWLIEGAGPVHYMMSIIIYIYIYIYIYAAKLFGK